MALPCGVHLQKQEIDTVTGELVGNIIIEPRSCRCNACPTCGRRNRQQQYAHYKREFSDLMNGGFDFVAATLTADPGVRHLDGRRLSQLETAHALKTWFTKIRGSLVSKLGGSGTFKYLCVLDLRTDGTPHLHVLMAYRSETMSALNVCGWMRTRWFDYGGGVATEIRPLDHANLSDSIGKVVHYIVHGTRLPGVRNVLVSQHLGFNSKKAKQERYEYAVARAQERGETIYGYLPIPAPERSVADDLRDQNTRFKALRDGAEPAPSVNDAPPAFDPDNLDCSMQTRSYVHKGSGGTWTETTRHEDGSVIDVVYSGHPNDARAVAISTTRHTRNAGSTTHEGAPVLTGKS